MAKGKARTLMPNIFAEELQAIMEAHGRTLGGMFGMSLSQERMHPQKVTLIIHSLEDDSTAVLSAWEIDILKSRLPLAEDEYRRLKVAIFAETIRFMVWSRAKNEAEHQGIIVVAATRQTAYRLGRLTFEILAGLQGANAAQAIQEMVDKLRGIMEEEETTSSLHPQESESSDDAHLPSILRLAADRYGQGSLWLEMSRDLSDQAQRRAGVAHAREFFSRAHSLMDDMDEAVQSTQQYRDLRELIEQGQADAEMVW